MKCHFAGLEIRISFFFCLLLSLILLFDNGYVLLAMASVCAHESAHLFAMLACGATVKGIDFEAFGIIIRRREDVLSWRKNICISLAGCAANFLIATVFLALFLVRENEKLFLLSLINYLLFFIHILPVPGLDGAQALEEFISAKKGREKAQKVLKLTGAVCCFMTLVAGMIICLKIRFYPSAFLPFLFLLLQYIGKWMLEKGFFHRKD